MAPHNYDVSKTVNGVDNAGALPFKVVSPNVQYSNRYIEADYDYDYTLCDRDSAGQLTATPKSAKFHFRTDRQTPRLGVMLVGWGGNNGTTVTAAVLANKLKLSWNRKTGVQTANYYGSVTQSSTVALGTGTDGENLYIPLKDMLPMVDPNSIVFDGWDISSANLADAMKRAEVLDWQLQEQLSPLMKTMTPRPSVYIPDFIAANQADRADNVLRGTKKQMVDQIREDIRDFKSRVDKVIVLWTANTERFCAIAPGLNDTGDSLLASIEANRDEISPSSMFAVASILEGCTFINGSPQNTFVPGVLDLAAREAVYVAGDDFKSGQTKIKSVLVDFLIGAGIKPVSIVSYNHLGNNDGKNLNAPQQFRSKEISKSNVVDDMVSSNRQLYAPTEKPDHSVVIKYVPYVGDSKRAMDEYTSEIMMGGTNTIVLHNTCEDSLLASPIILDLVILAELFDRIQYRVGPSLEYQRFDDVLSVLSYLLKAPLVPRDAPVVNALFRQRACIENVLRACVGLGPTSNMSLEHQIRDKSHLREAVVSTTDVMSEKLVLNGFIGPEGHNGILN